MSPGGSTRACWVLEWHVLQLTRSVVGRDNNRCTCVLHVPRAATCFVARGREMDQRAFGYSFSCGLPRRSSRPYDHVRVGGGSYANPDTHDRA